MEYFLRKELPEIVSNGAFGKNVEYVSFELNEDQVGQAQYMSTVLFGTVTTSDESKHHVFIKLKPRNEKQRKKGKIDFQFHNEITMYEEVIPFLFQCHRSMPGVEDCPTLPRYFYGRNKCGKFIEKDLVILEDVNPLGFKLCEERLFIDYDHLIIALQALAKLHGLSYIAKHKDHDHLKKIVMDILDTEIEEDGKWRFKNNSLIRFSKRGVDRLLERSGDLYRDNEYLRRFNELIIDGDNSLRNTLVPREPFSVVCHGDFNRNNILFRYDETGLPVDVLLFDFGTPRYGSPALDISFFLYMNTTQNLREKEFVPPGVRVPSRAELDFEMAACTLFGFSHASFFVPHQFDQDNTLKEEMSDEEILEWLLQLGGDAGTDLVADMVQHIVDMKYTNVLRS